MKYQDAELLRHLGAEYVLGTLRGPARRRFERLLRSRPEAQEQVDFWEMRLSEFGQIVEPIAPPLAARAAILRHAAPPVRTAPRPSSPARHNWRWAWSYVAGFATAASLVLGFLIGQRTPPAPPAKQPGLAKSVLSEPLPMYVTQLRLPASSMQWLVSVSADHKRLDVMAADDFLQAGRHALQLWCFVAGQAPLSLGVLPYERDATVSFALPESLRGERQVSFAVSLEPAGGSPLNQPSGPVLNEAAALDSI